MAPRRSKRNGASKKTKLGKAAKREVRSIARQQFSRMNPLLYVQKSYGGWINGAAEIDPAFACIQAPFQDIPMVVGAVIGTNQRLGAVLRLERLKLHMLLRRSFLPGPPVAPDITPQLFRVMVFRSIGEANIVTSNALNGWEPKNTEALHVLPPGKDIISLPYVKNQVSVLFDKTYKVENSEVMGRHVRADINLRGAKMTFESAGQGTAAVGAGNIFVVVTSNLSYKLGAYYTTGIYRDFQ